MKLLGIISTFRRYRGGFGSFGAMVDAVIAARTSLYCSSLCFTRVNQGAKVVKLSELADLPNLPIWRASRCVLEDTVQARPGKQCRNQDANSSIVSVPK
jgi:hypothetical protein